MEAGDQPNKVCPPSSSTKAGHPTIRFELSFKYLILAFLVFCICLVAPGDDPVNTSRTWNREISRIVYARCASCHRPGATAFSLITYPEARPWAAAIKEEVLERRMPPWGAVKGFGDFRNDQSLTQAQLDLIENWVDGGAPEGDPNDLPPQPGFSPLSPIEHRPGELVIKGEYRFSRPFKLDGFWPEGLPPAASVQITAALPDGKIEPLVWLHDYTAQYGHPFLLRMPMFLPSGTVIHGVPPGSTLTMLPLPEHHNARATAGDLPAHEKSSLNSHQ
jgi:hypothetical protein